MYVFESTTTCCDAGVEVVPTTVANDLATTGHYCLVTAVQMLCHTKVYCCQLLKPSHVVALTHSTVQNGWTALEQASISGHNKVVEVLLGAGANPNLQNKVSTGQNRILRWYLTFGVHPFCMVLVMHYENIYLYFVLIMVQPFICILYPYCWAFIQYVQVTPCLCQL